jgi:hypothetical protein
MKKQDNVKIVKIISTLLCNFDLLSINAWTNPMIV